MKSETKNAIADFSKFIVHLEENIVPFFLTFLEKTYYMSEITKHHMLFNISKECEDFIRNKIIEILKEEDAL